MYSSKLDRTSNEDAFNQLYVYPVMLVIAEAITTHEYKTFFVQGQPTLESMTKQLRASGLFTDEKSQYKTDGQIKVHNMKNLEFLLLETSGCFLNDDRVKLNFDHHKGMFGALAMMKCIADDFCLGSVEKFSAVKVFFLNVAGAHSHLWSLSFKEEGLFDFCWESSLSIQPMFEDRGD